VTATGKRWPLLFAALLLALVVIETGVAVLARYRVAGEADWQAAAATVRAGFRPGDLIVFAPVWMDQVGRSYLGDLMPIEMVARSDADHYGRIWEVSIRGARAPETAGAQREFEHDHGLVRVARWKNPPPAPVTVRYDFTAHLAEALVTQLPVDGRGDERPCFQEPRDGDAGFGCASTHVGRRTLEIDYRPRRGVLVPVDQRLVTRLEYSAVPLGSTLVGYTGLHDYYARKNADGPVDFAVFIDDQPVHRGRTGNADAWKRFAIDTSRLAGAPHRVRFEVSAPAPAWRNFGFHVEARP
jgi:hypothetical protein